MPYLNYDYARVLGAYHAYAKISGPGRSYGEFETVCFLWVRWYQTINPDTFGWENSELEKLSFPRFQVHNRPVSSFRRRDFSYRIAVQNAFNTENDNTLACMLGKCGPF